MKKLLLVLSIVLAMTITAGATASAKSIGDVKVRQLDCEFRDGYVVVFIQVVNESGGNIIYSDLKLHGGYMNPKEFEMYYSMLLTALSKNLTCTIFFCSGCKDMCKNCEVSKRNLIQRVVIKGPEY